MQAQVREWYLQAFAQIQAGTTGAITLADEAGGENATPDKGADASSDRQMSQQKVEQDFEIVTQSSCPIPLCVTLTSSPRDMSTDCFGFLDSSAPVLRKDECHAGQER